VPAAASRPSTRTDSATQSSCASQGFGFADFGAAGRAARFSSALRAIRLD
jgi:hypothetical protein